MPTFEFGRCPDCEFVVPLMAGGAIARHYRKYGTHAHGVVRQLCLGYGFPPRGSPVVIEAATARRARQIASR